jgi:hypothetical protein
MLAINLRSSEIVKPTNGGHQDQNLCDNRDARRLLVLRTKRAEHIRTSLPEGSHDDDPAEAIVAKDRLDEMCNSEETEQDREHYRSTEAGRILPQSVASVGGNVAMSSGSCIRTRARCACVDWQIERQGWYGNGRDRDRRNRHRRY